MGYSEDDAMVRVDFFKPTGKWYCTEAVKWTGDYFATHPNRFDSNGNNVKGQLLHDAFKQSLRDHFKNAPSRLSEMDAVCLAPYHEHAHPIQIKQGGWAEPEAGKCTQEPK